MNPRREYSLVPWLLCLLLLTSCARPAVPARAGDPPSSQPAGPTARAAPQEPSNRTPGFFWTVKSGKATAYLLGSIHVGARDFYPLPEVIERAFERASTLLIEVDLTGPGLLTARRAVAQRLLDQPGDSLDRHLSPETLETLRQRLSADGIPHAQAMADAIDRLLGVEGTSFVILGVGHLLGPESVVELLRRKGHRVTRS